MLKNWQRRLAPIGPAFLYHLARTWRIRVSGELPDGAAVIVCWQDNMLPLWKHLAGRQTLPVLVSPWRHSGMYAGLAARWGFNTVGESPQTDSGKAPTGLASVLRQGQRVLVAPDVSRGQRHCMNRDVVAAAHCAGVPLVLCRIATWFAVDGGYRDCFRVPLPFARIEIEFVILDFPRNADRFVLDRLNSYAEKVLRHATPLS